MLSLIVTLQRLLSEIRVPSPIYLGYMFMHTSGPGCRRYPQTVSKSDNAQCDQGTDRYHKLFKFHITLKITIIENVSEII